MNLRDWYFADDFMLLLGVRHDMQFFRFLRKNPGRFETYNLGGSRMLYSRLSVERYFNEEFKTPGTFVERVKYERRRLQIPRYNLDLSEWVPRGEALEKYFPYSYEMLHLLTTRARWFPSIRFQTIKNLTFYNVEDMKKQVKKMGLDKNEKVV